MTTPLSQTSFFPDFTQVNIFPETIEVAPALVHVPPAFAVVAALIAPCPKIKTKDASKKIELLRRLIISER